MGGGKTGEFNYEDQIEDRQGQPEFPGKYIGVNDGDADNDGVPNLADGFRSKDADNSGANAGGTFTEMSLTVPEPVDLGKARLRFTYAASDPDKVSRTGAGTPTDPHVYTPAPGNLRLWIAEAKASRSAKSIAEAGGQFVAAYTEACPSYTAAQLGLSAGKRTVPLYVEGIRPSDSLADQQIKVELDPDGAGPDGAGPAGWVHADAVRLTIVKVDLDIDSDNTAELAAPDQGDQEEALEDFPALENLPAHPGKAVAINELDRDRDAVPDFADGYDVDFGDGSQAAANASYDFVPVVLEFSKAIALDKATVTFKCATLSDPGSVKRSGTGSLTPADPYVYTITDGGRIRLWLGKNGAEARRKALVPAGDAVLKDKVIKVADLNPDADRKVKLYLEGLARSAASGDQTIKVELDPDGAGLPAAVVEDDQVKATVFTVDKVHPLDADFAAGNVGKAMISTKQNPDKNTAYHTNAITTKAGKRAQSEDAKVTISAYVLPKPPDWFKAVTVYFEVTDPDDLSPYEGKVDAAGNPQPGTPNDQGDPNPNDNRDPAKRMTWNAGAPAGYAAYQGACLTARSATAEVLPINKVQHFVAETTLNITDRCSGDNYQVRATLRNPHNDPFDTLSGMTANAKAVRSVIGETERLIAWKRVYIEQDNMYTRGCTVMANLPGDGDAADDVLQVDATDDLLSLVGKPVFVFWPGHLIPTTVKNASNAPTVTITGGGGAGATAFATVVGGAVVTVGLSNRGANYTTEPIVTIAGGSGAGATARALLGPTSVGAIAVGNSGAGYGAAPAVTIDPPHVATGGVQATATATVAGGQVTAITITNPGAGYVLPPTVTLLGGGGATATSTLTPGALLQIRVTSPGAGYGTPTVTVADLGGVGVTVPRFAGIRPATIPPTQDVSRRYLPDAFGNAPNGSDAGAFIEFASLPKEGDSRVPKYRDIQGDNNARDFAIFWFKNYADRANNVMYLLAGNSFVADNGSRVYGMNTFDQATGLLDSICVIWDGQREGVNQRDDSTAHEIGHRCGMNQPPFGGFVHVDRSTGLQSHDANDRCLMGYDRNRNDAVVEFSINCLLTGSAVGAGDSLRDRADH